MKIERTTDEILIRLPAYLNMDNLEKIIAYLAYTEATSHSQATQEEIDQLAKEVKKDWWAKNKTRFIK